VRSYIVRSPLFSNRTVRVVGGWPTSLHRGLFPTPSETPNSFLLLSFAPTAVDPPLTPLGPVSRRGVVSSRPPCATFLVAQKQDHRENRYLESRLRPHPACNFIQHHNILWWSTMPIGLETTYIPGPNELRCGRLDTGFREDPF
jgi:hypothetical protein